MLSDREPTSAHIDSLAPRHVAAKHPIILQFREKVDLHRKEWARPDSNR